MKDGVVPISDDERKGRIAKAQKLMNDQKIDAIFMEGTTSCFYYTGMRWGQSERTFGVVIPAKGELCYVCPGFEEDRARELLKPVFGNEVRVWQEDESPYAVIAGIVKDRGAKYHRIGVEERVRFFIADGIRKAASGSEVVDATPVTAGCRVIKSKAEIALMQRANDVTIAAYKAGLQTLRDGMPQDELQRNIMAGFSALGFPGFVSVQFGKYTAIPHGSATPQKLKEGDVVMIDDGVQVEGYASDITRSVVFGKATARQTEVWNKELEAQTAAFKAIKIGAPCESVDAAARKVITDAGFGPGYKIPRFAASHRARNRTRRPRVDKLREGQHDTDRRRNVLQRRTDDRDSRRVRNSPRGLRVCIRRWPALFLQAERRNRRAVRGLN